MPTASALATARTPRQLHPVAWWSWAIGMAVAANRTSNPLLLVLVLAVLGLVIACRRSDAPWARAFQYYLVLALVVIVTRVVFRAVFASGIQPDDHILFSLPHLDTPDWYAGIRLGGAVSLEATLSAAFDGLRLGTLLCCVGAANVLANPKRALRVLPGALYELGVAVVVALSVAPQLVESAQRVNRARRLRGGHGRGLRPLRSIVVPVLEDAFERSLRLAAGMDSRGYGRVGDVSRARRRITGLLLSLGMCGLCVGVYGLVDPTVPRLLGLPAVATGVLLCAAGLHAGGRRVQRTAYRPDRWRTPESLVAGGGVVCATVMFLTVGYDPTQLNPGLYPLAFPSLPLLPVAAILAAGAAALTAPPPVRRSPAPRPGSGAARDPRAARPSRAGDELAGV
ncbi:energy-coupling factor transport system permease protein [Jatrophihabitans endophyticus]|uniref:Energy-coupling factor transport system permease protein n=1 Tax=Jatrophihabitans endophyticus TaxID=1206085 RepID=A0A1M5ITC4_9ACTN|nr:CbiQ family ECF transporter T component [Jatrophihabitans endophyticus]SHG31574.1 energy-coupling factor transport system permease protein [Jatrophihabitans endophyticus]